MINPINWRKYQFGWIQVSKIFFKLTSVLWMAGLIIPLHAQNSEQAEALPASGSEEVISSPEVMADSLVPNYWDFNTVKDLPSIENIGTIRFLMSDDFPPFSYRTPENRLAGFHIDLARALCAQLDISCVVSIRPFRELEAVLKDDSGDAIMAGLSIPRGLEQGFIFSDIYLTTPARFVTHRNMSDIWPSPETLKDRTIGVVKGTAHEVFVTRFFKDAKPVVFESRFAARRDIVNGKIDFLFDDGLSLSFWLNGEKSQNCCRFIGGPYTESLFFGDGFAIAFTKDKQHLKHGFDYALQELAKNGTFAELYLRYFPISFFGSNEPLER